jgi:hypothetical protein
MLDFKTQSQLVDATSAMMRAYLSAATQGWTVSAHRGLALWVDMLGGSRRSIPHAWPRPSLGPWLGSDDRPALRRPQDAATGSTIPAGFSSYRSDGGHAVAQIIAPEPGINTPLDPMHAMLGLWRTALGG